MASLGAGGVAGLSGSTAVHARLSGSRPPPAPLVGPDRWLYDTGLLLRGLNLDGGRRGVWPAGA